MKFRTEYKAVFYGDLVNYGTPVMTIGSCFADHLGKFLGDHGFPVVSNPFGVLFNPVSILEALKNAQKETVREDGCVTRDEHFFHFDYHSEIHAPTADELIGRLNSINRTVQAELVGARVLIITLGTAWVYRHRQSSKIVANCHKIPAGAFQKELLDLEQLKGLYTDFLAGLRESNPDLQVILTVSPVRHIKDGLVENNRSKVILLLLCHFLQARFSNVHYFPAYEIVMDDLRDYRFFKEDLVHPTDQAVEYVLEKFAGSFFTPKTLEAVAIKAAILKARRHMFRFATEKERATHDAYIRNLEERFDELKSC